MTLIKTSQHWLHRMIDLVLTLAAWAAFTFLLVRGLKAMAEASRSGAQQDLTEQMVHTFGTLMVYTLCAVLIGLALFAWAKYNEIRARRFDRRTRVSDIGERTLMRSFGVTSETYRRLRAQQVAVLHNDEIGDLVWVEDPVFEVSERSSMV